MDYEDELYDDYPCTNCSQNEECDSWESRYCCELCAWEYDDATPCDDCDPMDL